jgi:sporulation protein YlmC with PRC-barrel domain
MNRFATKFLRVVVSAAAAWGCLASFAEPGTGRETADQPALDRLALVQRATQLMEMEIDDQQRHEIGRVDDLLLDFSSSQVVGVLAAPAQTYGDLHVLVPAASFLSVSGSKAILASEKTNLTVAPRMLRASAESADSAALIAESYAYFGAKPLWQNKSGPRGTMTFSRLVGLKIRNRASEDLGKLIDLAVDVPAGRIVLAVASLDGTTQNEYGAPCAAFSPDPQNSALLFATEKASLAQFTLDSGFLWAQMTNPGWVAAAYHRYAQASVSVSSTQVKSKPPEPAPASIETTSPGARTNAPPAARAATPADPELNRNILLALVREHLDTAVSENQVRITITGGHVTLRGNAENAEQKRKLRAIVEEVAGPANVDDQIELPQ